MKKLLTFLFLLIFSVTYSQGVGYLNYTIYNEITYNGGAGSYANNSTNFDNMFNTANGTTIYKTGIGTANTTLNYNGTFLTGVPNGGGYFGIKTSGYFVPKETGTYYFGVDGDDGVDVVINGAMVTSFYGAHGFNGYRYGSVNLVAGQVYTFMARFQQVGGGWGISVVWKRPSQNSYSIQSDEVTTLVSTPTKKAISNFNFNTNIDATKFSIGTSTSTSAGVINITNSLDSAKVSTGYKALTIGGQIEWCVIYDYETNNGRYRIGIDSRQMTINASNVNQLKLFDLWDGPVTYSSYDPNGWSEYYIYTNNQFNFDASTYLSHIRAGNGYHALTADFSYSATQSYKPQSILLTTTNNLTTLYNSIVTVSDVYMAFQEYSNQGLFGNQMGSSFTYGIQYQNADIDNNNIFDENDCFLLLQNLTGTKPLVDTFNLNKTIRIIPQSKYDSIGKSNWNIFTNPLGSSYTFDINTGKSTDTLNLAVAWKGDVNLSHSTTPKSNNITTFSIKSTSISNEIQSTITSELVGDSVVVTITLNPLSQQVVGTQFMLNYDNSLLKFSTIKFTAKGTPTNYGTDKGTYINVGSIISDGSTALDNTTTYKISFKTLTKLNNTFGLISVGGTDAVSQNGTQLKIRLI